MSEVARKLSVYFPEQNGQINKTKNLSKNACVVLREFAHLSLEIMREVNVHDGCMQHNMCARTYTCR